MQELFHHKCIVSFSVLLPHWPFSISTPCPSACQPDAHPSAGIKYVASLSGLLFPEYKLKSLCQSKDSICNPALTLWHAMSCLIGVPLKEFLALLF